MKFFKHLFFFCSVLNLSIGQAQMKVIDQINYKEINSYSICVNTADSLFKVYKKTPFVTKQLPSGQNFNGLGYINQIYLRALELKPNDDYAMKQHLKCEELMRKSTQKEVYKQYEKVIDAADKKFKEGEYERALELYIRAIGLNPTDKYPQKRKIKIEKILNQ